MTGAIEPVVALVERIAAVAARRIERHNGAILGCSATPALAAPALQLEQRQSPAEASRYCRDEHQPTHCVQGDPRDP